MCLIFLSFRQHPKYKFILAANRDEFYKRRTAPADFWSDFPYILGGRDLEANGTWLGMTRSGRISLITNYRDPAHINPHAPSRGRLVSDFLELGKSEHDYLTQIEQSNGKYNGFNLLAGTVDGLSYLSNYANGIKVLGSGLYGLSNHLLDTPWPKVVRGKERIQPILEKPTVDPDVLFEFLYDTQQSNDKLLPDTGIGLERERALSSMFIKTPNYGSRCSTVVLVDHANHVLFAERVYDVNTFTFSLKTFEFDTVGEGSAE